MPNDTTSQEEQSAIVRALELWRELTGIDPGAERYSIAEYDIRRVFDELNESLKLEKSNVLTLLLIDYFVEEYLTQRSFSVNEVIGDYDKFRDYLKKAKEMYSILRSKDLNQVRQAFKNRIVEALRYYGFDSKENLDFVEDRHSLPFLWRDALRSVKNLEVHQFLQEIRTLKNRSTAKSSTRHGISTACLRFLRACLQAFLFVLSGTAWKYTHTSFL